VEKVVIQVTLVSLDILAIRVPVLAVTLVIVEVVTLVTLAIVAVVFQDTRAIVEKADTLDIVEIADTLGIPESLATLVQELVAIQAIVVAGILDTAVIQVTQENLVTLDTLVLV